MPKITITCNSQSTVDFLLNIIGNLETVAKDEINMDIVMDQLKVLKGRVKAPQVRYFAHNPANLPEALKTLGEHTIMGIIYKDVAEATIRAREVGERAVLETTRSLAERRHFNQKSLERSLVQLRQAGLVDSERIG